MSDETQPKESPRITQSSQQVNLGGPIDFSPGATVGRFYANHAQAHVSLFEIRLILNFVAGADEKTHRLVGLESLMVSMSPELAFAIHALLGTSIENYKKQFGSLRMPDLIQTSPPPK